MTPTRDENETKTDDEPWESLHPSSPMRSAGSGEDQKIIDTMGYNVDCPSWVLAEALKASTCQPTSQPLIEGVAPVSYACRDLQRCPRWAAQKQIDDQYEDPEMYKGQAIYIIQALEAFKSDPFYPIWKESLKESSFAWVLITTKAIKHEKGVSYYGAVMIPAYMAEGVCSENGLGSYFVQRRWRDAKGSAGGKKAFDCSLAFHPTNAVYYSWLKAQLCLETCCRTLKQW